MIAGTLLVLFILFTDYLNTNYCPSQILNNFVLRKTFYSRQGLRDTCRSSVYIGYKETLQYRASTWKVISTLLQHYILKQWVCLNRGLCLVPAIHNNLLVATTNPLGPWSSLVFWTLDMLSAVKDDKRVSSREGLVLGGSKERILSSNVTTQRP